jgi:transcriptional adapter 2-alpha
LDLRTTTFVKCAECFAPSVDLCLLCFTGKYEVGQHRADHAYYVLTGDHLQEDALYSTSLGEILLLLDSTRKFSVGSWTDVQMRSKMISPGQCEKVFMELYSTWKGSAGGEYPQQDFELDTNCLDSCTLENGAGMLVQSVPIPKFASDIPGFMPNRVDFELEYDDTAELILADIEINDDDLPHERELKMEVLRSYTERVRRREMIKTFVCKQGLTSVQNQLDRHRCRTSEEVELRGKLRPVERFFNGVEEFDSFVQLVLYEQRLMARIRSLRNRLESGRDVPIKMEDDVKNSELANDDSKENKDLVHSKPATRSRTASESRKGRTAEDECNRINDALNDDSLTKSIIESLDPKEVELLTQLGMDGKSFAVLRDVVLKRCAESGFTQAELCLSKYGSSFKLEISPTKSV